MNPGGDQQEDIPTLSARIEEKQKRVDSRKEIDNERGREILVHFVYCRPGYQNNKIFPNNEELFPGEAEERRR